MTGRRSARDSAHEAAVGIVLYVAVGVLRPSWLARHLHLTLEQHFRRLLLRHVVVHVGTWLLAPFEQRSAAATEELRRELGREPTIEEVIAHLEQRG